MNITLEPNSLVKVDPAESESLLPGPRLVRSIEGFFLSCNTLDLLSSGTATFPPSGFLSAGLDSKVTLGAVARLFVSRRLTGLRRVEIFSSLFLALDRT